MLGILTDDHDLALALDDLALFANRFYRRSYFHGKYLLMRPGSLGTPCDAALCQIIG